MRRNPRQRYRGLALGAMLVSLVLVAAACGSSSNKSNNTTTSAAGAGATSTPAANMSITVGEKNFAGAQVISQLYGQALAAKGFKTTYKQLGPTEQAYAAVKSGNIDLYGEYQGTLLESLGGTATGDAKETNDRLQARVKTDNIKASTPSTAVDVNGFYVTKKTAADHNLKTLSDLVAVAGTLTFGGPPECETRDLCLGKKEQNLYGLKFKSVKKLDTGGPITVSALKDNSIQVGLLFTGSSVIDPDFVLLTDDKGLQPADAAIAVWSNKVDSSQLSDVIDSVNAKLDTAAYNELTLKVQNDKQDPSAVAKAWLQQEGLA
jgi:osmoprotectant transport system substrate-binding protein